MSQQRQRVIRFTADEQWHDGKMPYFLYHRELLGDMARLAYETVREMMLAAADTDTDTDAADARPGMVAVIQTFASSLKWNPHVHSIASRGLFTTDGQWIPVPYVDTHKAELVFRHKILRLLRDRELISQERIDLLLSWRNSGFSVHNRTTVYPDDTEGLHRLACYLMRTPVNLSRLRSTEIPDYFSTSPKVNISTTML